MEIGRLPGILKAAPDVTWTSPFISLTSLRSFVELYFSNFDSNFPILHRPTLTAQSNPSSSILLAVIAVIGAAYAEQRDAKRIAAMLYKRLRQYLVGVSAPGADVGASLRVAPAF
jgi:hypothetical protein